MWQEQRENIALRGLGTQRGERGQLMLDLIVSIKDLYPEDREQSWMNWGVSYSDLHFLKNHSGYYVENG